MIVYLDDIIIFSKSFEDHVRDLVKVFERLRAANIKLKATKCQLFQKEIVYLGHLVTREGIRPDPSKIKALEKMEPPQNLGQLRAFIGLSGYYRNFVNNYAIVCDLLYDLTKMHVRFKWEEKHQKAFEYIVRALCAMVLLYHPNYSLPFIIRTDACDTGIGAVLAQEVDGIERVIQFASRTLQPGERKWCVREKEALAILWACETFRVYVYGTRFTVETDHHSLQWLLNAKEPPRLVRWALRLAEFDFEIKYRKGKANQVADALSRLPLDPPAVEDEDRHDQLLIVRANLITKELKLTSEEVIEAQASDPELNPLIETCRAKGGRVDEYVLEDNLLFKTSGPKKLLVVPYSLVERILHLYHNETMSAHVSRDRLSDILTNRFYWPRMKRDIADWVAACLVCRKVKPTRPLRHGLLQPVAADYPFEKVGVDIMGPIHATKDKFRYVLVCVDYFTNWVEAAPLRSITASEIVEKFFSLIISRHGCPKIVISDQGKQFVSKSFEELCSQFQMKHEPVSAYHQQANGKVERFIGYLKKTLATITKSDQSNWDKLLDNSGLSSELKQNAG